jgi:hypothetical protein
MTRIAIRHTLFALAVVVLVSVVESGSTAQAVSQTSQAMSNIVKADSDAKLTKPKTPKGLATKKSGTSASGPKRLQPTSLLGIVATPSTFP